jgi:hypothetical protein
MEYLQDTSVAEVYDFIKQFHFCLGDGVDLYSNMTFSDVDKIRVSPVEGVVKLKRDQTTQFYPLDDDIWARTRVTNPKSCRKLKMLEVLPVRQPNDTEVLLRIYNGTEDLYWDGTDWVVPGATDWNTEAEINEGIGSYPVLPDRTFAITMNLRTTDHEVTPVVDEIRVLMEVHIDYIEDIVLRSLMPAIKEQIRPTTNFIIPAFNVDTSSINLSEYKLNTPYEVVDVAGVYDFTDDSELLTNLLSSYNTSTKVITLSAAIPATHKAFVLFRYSPELVFIQHQDWYEASKLPCLLIQRLEIPFASAYNLVSREGIVDKGTGNAVVIQEPWRATMEFRLHGLTTSVLDEMRLMSGVMKFFEDNFMIRSVGLDEHYRVRIDREFRDLSNPDRSDQRAFWTLFSIYDIRMPMVSKEAQSVRGVNITFKGPKPPHEDPIKGGSRVIITTHTEDGPVEWSETVKLD